MFKSVFRNTLKRSIKGSGTRHYACKSYSRFNYVLPKLRISLPIILGLAGLSSYSMYNTVDLDNSQKDLENNISVDASISPFPTKLKKSYGGLTTDYSLLGYGVRSVTFVGFKVYGIGLYIADEDIFKARKLLGNKTYLDSLKANSTVKELLSDPDNSIAIIEKLLDANIKFCTRICPVRNTDFNHLKDGLIKSILAHPRSKEGRDIVGKGLEELKNIFQIRRGSVPKNHLLYLEILSGGKLGIIYENTDTNQLLKMGTVNEPMVSKILFLQYLSGRKPLSEPLRTSCVEGFECL